MPPFCGTCGRFATKIKTSRPVAPQKVVGDGWCIPSFEQSCINFLPLSKLSQGNPCWKRVVSPAACPANFPANFATKHGLIPAMLTS